MAIIDRTYFALEGLRIPNSNNEDVSSVNTPTVETTLDVAIKNGERDLLLNALGVDLYNQLIVAEADIDNPIYAKWKLLIEGTDYIINGRKHRWDGLKGYDKQSLIAFYIKSEYLKNEELKYTSGNMVVNVSKNSVKASYIKEFITSRTKFTNMYQGSIRAVHEYPSRYNNKSYKETYETGFRIGNESYISSREVQSSMFQYLCDQNELDSTAFPEFEFKFYYKHNRFGL